MKAELDVFVSTGGLRLEAGRSVLGSFPLQRIQEWSITSPGTFSLSVVNGEKVVGLVIHGDPDEVFAIIDCLARARWRRSWRTCAPRKREGRRPT